MTYCYALQKSDQSKIIALFTDVFTNSEGPSEGKMLGDLTQALSTCLDAKDVLGFGISEYDQACDLDGAIFLTRLFCDIELFMLAPVAVSTKHQGKGLGQNLIRFGIEELRKRGVEALVTYGDPKFYAKVGFMALSESYIPAPHKLSMPVGWLGQSLTGGDIPTLKSAPTCVMPFDNPVYW